METNRTNAHCYCQAQTRPRPMLKPRVLLPPLANHRHSRDNQTDSKSVNKKYLVNEKSSLRVITDGISHDQLTIGHIFCKDHIDMCIHQQIYSILDLLMWQWIISSRFKVYFFQRSFHIKNNCLVRNIILHILFIIMPRLCLGAQPRGQRGHMLPLGHSKKKYIMGPHLVSICHPPFSTHFS